MAYQEKQLGQARENSTNAVSVYSPPASTTAIIRSIFLANTTANAETFRIFVDDDGTTYDQSTALHYDVAIDPNSTVQIDAWIAMNDATGNIAYQSSTANALTITLFGVEI